MKLSCHSLLLSVESIVNHFNHGTIKPTGITSNKILCYMHDSACRLYIVKEAKIVMLNIFELLLVRENAKS